MRQQFLIIRSVGLLVLFAAASSGAVATSHVGGLEPVDNNVALAVPQQETSKKVSAQSDKNLSTDKSLHDSGKLEPSLTKPSIPDYLKLVNFEPYQASEPCKL